MALSNVILTTTTTKYIIIISVIKEKEKKKRKKSHPVYKMKTYLTKIEGVGHFGIPPKSAPTV